MNSPAPLRGPADPAGESLVGRVLEGRYRVEARLGEGGLGTVYRAQHLKLARPVAVKVLREDLRSIPQIRARFEREVKALSSLAHPNVVTITDYGVADGSPYLVMELVEGVELGRVIGAPMPPARALAIVRQILASLVYAHERDVVHRDLKPANVIVRQLPDGRDHVVVLDFGLAKFVGEDAGGDLTRSGLVVGTPAYMPPEQMAAGARRADARSDLYSAGLILFELITGRRPFQYEDAADLLRAHLVTEPPTLSEALGGTRVSPALQAVVDRALAKAPDDRFAAAKKMIEAIDALPAGSLVGGDASRAALDETRPARPTPLSQERSQRSIAARSSRRRGGVLAAIALGALGIATIAWLAGSGPDAGDAEETAAVSPASVAATEPGTTPAAGPRARVGAVAETAAGAAAELGAGAVAMAETMADSVAETMAEAAAATEVEGATTAETEDDAALEEAEAPFVPPPVVGPRPPARNPLRGRLTGLLGRVYQRIQRGREVSQGDLRALARYRNQHPLDPRVRLILGHAYVGRGFYSLALDQYDRATAIDLAVRGDPRLLSSLIRMVRSDAVTTRATASIVRIYGREARAEVQRAMSREDDPAQRARLEALLAQLRAS